jgi:hypothetical protein
LGWGGFYLGPSHRVAAAFSARGCPHGKKLCTAHYFSTGIRNLRLSKNFLPFGCQWPGRPGRVAVRSIKAATKTAPTLLTLAAVVQGMVSEMSGRKMSYTITIEGKGAAAAAPKPFKTGKLRGRPPKDPAKKAAEAEQKRRDAHKKATIDFDKVYDDRKRYLDAGIGDEFAGWRADIERLPDRFARPFQSRPRGASRPVRLGLPGRFGVRTGCQFPQVCPPPCRSATSGAPGTNLGYLTHATTPPGRRTFAAGSSAPACAASASSGRAPRA